MKQKFNLMPFSTPIAFCDGSKIYKDLNKKYKIHEKGLFILAPSGAGKTHYVKNDVDNNWIDGDELWMATKAHPKGAWWFENQEVILEVDQRSDIVTAQARKLGYWIVGASNYWLQPDAIVMPDWRTHKKYISLRETKGYDGGATSKQLSGVLVHRDWITETWGKTVPIFKSMELAAKCLTKDII